MILKNGNQQVLFPAKVTLIYLFSFTTLAKNTVDLFTSYVKGNCSRGRGIKIFREELLLQFFENGGMAALFFWPSMKIFGRIFCFIFLMTFRALVLEV